MEPSRPLGTTRLVPQEKFPQNQYNKPFIDQACSAKMAGYWPSSFFACLLTSTPSRYINTQKKNSANIQPSSPHTWSITHTYFMLCYVILCYVVLCCVVLEKFETVMQTRNVVEGLHNFREFSQPSEYLDEAI